MKVRFVDLGAQYRSLRADLDGAIRSVIEECAFIGGRDNPHIQRFEQAFAAFVGVEHGVSCANGTDSLEILLEAMDIGPGHEVIVPAHSWISTSESVTAVGGRPVFVDTEADTYTLDPARLESAITRSTRAIIPVHLYGLPADMDPILAIAKRHGLRVIEDCAQAHGATYKGRNVGTMGDAGSFSFYPGKNLGAYGDAGAIVTADRELAQRCRMIANHGQLKKHEHQREGRNSRMDGIQAAVLSVKLPHLERWTQQRAEAAAYYSRRLAEMPVTVPRIAATSTHVFHLYVVKVSDRSEVRAALSAAGIETGIHYPTALPALPPYQAQGNRAEDFPNAISNSHQVLSLPLFPEITRAEQDFVIEQLAAAVREKVT